jgi:trimeric autotransporter adhesin
MKNYFFYFLHTMCLMFFISNFYDLKAQVVGSSSVSTATEQSSQRKTVVATNGVQWMFFYNGTNIQYSSSEDGTSWIPRGSLPYATADFSLTLKQINGNDYLLIAVKNGFDVVLQRGGVTGTTINFDSSIVVFDGTSSTDDYRSATIAISRNNHLWVGAIYSGDALVKSDHQVMMVRRASGRVHESLTPLLAATSVGKNDYSIDQASLLPRSGDEMYLIGSGVSENVVGYSFNGSTWSEAHTGGDLSWFTFPGDGLNGEVFSMVKIASEIYVAGRFTNAGGVLGADYVARWNGTNWSSVAGQRDINNFVRSLKYHNNVLYLGGAFTNAGGDAAADYLASWNGSSWGSVGTSFLDARVNSIETVNNNLYIGGIFSNAGGIGAADRIASWNGSSWNSLGSGLSSTVNTITTNGTGLYAGGDFLDAGGLANGDRFAYWNGAAWSAIGSGLSNTVSSSCMVGPLVYVGGNFLDAGGNSNGDRIAYWNGSSWGSTGTGLNNSVLDLKYAASSLYVAGNFNDAGGDANADKIVVWNGSSFLSTKPIEDAPVNAVLYDMGRLYIGGNFKIFDGKNQNALFTYLSGGTTYSVGNSRGLNGLVYAITSVNNNIYLGGDFVNVGGIPEADYVVRWDGNNWQSLGSGLNNQLRTLFTEGNNLYAGGFFLDAGGVAAADRLAVWNGASWNAVAGTSFSPGVIRAGFFQGSTLYIGGDFLNAGGNPNADRVAFFNGSSWLALGAGLNDSSVQAITSNGSGVLYVGGGFNDAGGIANADRVAQWNGSTWGALGAGISNGSVLDISFLNNMLYVGGDFIDAGGNIAADYLGAWNGSIWNNVSTLNAPVSSLRSNGSSLYVGGGFFDAGNVAAIDKVGVWNGVGWVQVQESSDSAVASVNAMRALHLKDSQLYIGGLFSSVDNKLSRYFSYRSLSVAKNVGSDASVSSLVDNSNNTHILYKNSTNEVTHKEYSGTWGTVNAVTSSTSGNPSLLFDSNADNLYAVFTQGPSLFSAASSSPFSTWSSPTIFNGIGVNQGPTSVEANRGYPLNVAWVRGSSAPYLVVVQSVISSTATSTATPTPSATSTATPTPSATSTAMPTPTMVPQQPTPTPKSTVVAVILPTPSIISPVPSTQINPTLSHQAVITIESVDLRGKEVKSIKGKTFPNGVIEIFLDALKIGKTTSNEIGIWSFTFDSVMFPTSFSITAKSKNLLESTKQFDFSRAANLDLDGDYVSDPILYYGINTKSQSEVLFYSSISNVRKTHLKVKGSSPIAADFTGDGKTDLGSLEMKNQSLLWRVKLEDDQISNRVITDDFSHVLYGCYLDSSLFSSLVLISSKKVAAHFLNGEVKSYSVNLPNKRSVPVGCADVDGDSIDEILYVSEKEIKKGNRQGLTGWIWALNIEGNLVVRKKIHNYLSVHVAADRVSHDAIVLQSLYSKEKRVAYFSQLTKRVKKASFVSNINANIVPGVIKSGVSPMYRSFLQEGDSSGVSLIEGIGKKSKKKLLFHTDRKYRLLRSQRSYSKKELIS